MKESLLIFLLLFVILPNVTEDNPDKPPKKELEFQEYVFCNYSYIYTTYRDEPLEDAEVTIIVNGKTIKGNTNKYGYFSFNPKTCDKEITLFVTKEDFITESKRVSLPPCNSCLFIEKEIEINETEFEENVSTILESNINSTADKETNEEEVEENGETKEETNTTEEQQEILQEIQIIEENIKLLEEEIEKSRNTVEYYVLCVSLIILLIVLLYKRNKKRKENEGEISTS